MMHPTIAMMTEEQKRRELEHRSRAHWKQSQAANGPVRRRLGSMIKPVAAIVIRTFR